MYDFFSSLFCGIAFFLRASRGEWYHRGFDSPGVFSDYLIGVFDREGKTNPGLVLRDCGGGYKCSYHRVKID